MSKLVLFKAEMASIFAKAFMGKCFSFHSVLYTILTQYFYVGEEAKEKYIAVTTEWPNLMKSDVLYASSNIKNNSLPPILVEIQHTVNLQFYRRVNEYCLQIIKEYHIPPIVVAICINETTQNILDMESNKNLDIPYALQIPCSGWAKSFNLLNAGSIHPYLEDQPLDPIVAISHFFIEQKLSLISMEFKDDPNIQLLLALAKDILENDIREHGNPLVAINQVCKQTSYQFIKAKKRSIEDVEEPNCRKRMIRRLDDGIVYVIKMCEKHNVIL